MKKENVLASYLINLGSIYYWREVLKKRIQKILFKTPFTKSIHCWMILQKLTGALIQEGLWPLYVELLYCRKGARFM